MDSNGTSIAPQGTTLAERVRKVLAEAPAPLDFSKVKTAVGKLYPKGTKKAPQPPKPSDTEIQRELETEGVFVHPATTAKGKPKYWHRPPPPKPTPAEEVAANVRDKVKALGDDDVVAEAKLGKPTKAKATPETLKAFEDTLADLLGAGLLHRHGKNFGKRPPPPPKWHDIDPAKKAFTSLVTAAKKVVGLNAAPADEVIAVLRERLGLTQTSDRPKPVVSPPPVQPAPPPPPAVDLHAALRQAYDHLCKFPEFADGMVDLPSLFHETAHRRAVTRDEFRDLLWRMSEERKVQLHVLNDPAAAKEPDLGISRNDRLYYYARWN